jgi:DNA-binding MarR family transcriptional regulator
MEDSVDRHLARWRGKAPFDERVEAIITRIQLLARHVAHAKDRALAEAGLQGFEFETELAAELMVSPAGMTGRLATLENAGLVRRLRGVEDRRRVDVELTEQGHARWYAAMELRGTAEDGMVHPLTQAEQDTLIALLKRMLTQAESTR